MPVRDTLQRPLRDLRVSVTDRCNFRCTYCMPRDRFGPDHAFLDRAELLTFEEIERVVRAAVSLGVRKVRLTGGEPLVRRELPALVGRLARIDGMEDLALTTNGSLLGRHAADLKAAGLHRLTISLDSVDEAVFSSMADVDMPLAQVLAGIEAATEAGFAPIKLNAVVKRGVNDDGVVALAAYARERGHVVRFIEYMDVGTTNGWRLDDVVPAEEIIATVSAAYPLEPVPAAYPGEVATRWRYTDGRGEVGAVSSVTQPFCSTCTRARLSAIGEVYTCLFASRGADLRGLLRGGADDAEVVAFLRRLWGGRGDRYSEERSAATQRLDHVEMSYIGG
ncbi:MAG: GTP 3',8-cyclase MoaA [Egibacteraceae bacterium]